MLSEKKEMEQSLKRYKRKEKLKRSRSKTIPEGRKNETHEFGELETPEESAWKQLEEIG